MSNLSDLNEIESNPPILIYQMGKVGSSSVYKSLKNANIPYSLFHIHQLSEKGIKQKEDWLSFQKADQQPDIIADLQYIKQFKEFFDANRSRYRWKVITLTREPVILEISAFFENIDIYASKVFNDYMFPDKNKILDYFNNYFNTKLQYPYYITNKNYFLNWFENELKNAIDIDVYSKPFDHEKGFVIYEKENISVLVIRLEDIERVFSTAISTFLGIDGVKLVSDNLSRRKQYHKIYKEVTREISLSHTICEEIYASQYASHFYTPQECSLFMEKWTKVRTEKDVENLFPKEYEPLYAEPEEDLELSQCRFNNTIEIPGHGLIPASFDLRNGIKDYLGKIDFKDKRVLDIGSASGYCCFIMEQWGAQVVAFDLSPDFSWDIVPYAHQEGELNYMIETGMRNYSMMLNNGFWFTHNAFQSKIQMVYGTVYDIPRAIGKFDIVTCCHVLLHLRDPFLALQNIARSSEKTIVITECIPEHLIGNRPSQIIFRPDANFMEKEAVVTWWYIPPEIVMDYLKILGFKNITITHHKQLWRDNDQTLYPLPFYTIVANRTQ